MSNVRFTRNPNAARRFQTEAKANWRDMLDVEATVVDVLAFFGAAGFAVFFMQRWTQDNVYYFLAAICYGIMITGLISAIRGHREGDGE